MRSPGSHLFNPPTFETWIFSLIGATGDTNRRFVLKIFLQLLLQPQELSIFKPHRHGNSLSVVVTKAVFESKVGSADWSRGPDKSEDLAVDIATPRWRQR